MSQLSDIIEITISRQTATVASANFGTPGIISEFASDKTTVTFDRYRTYASIAEMVTDGWVSTDQEYIRANLIFSQNPRPSYIMIGRKKPDTEAVETWATALTAIEAATSDWYCFTINPTQTSTVVFSADLITSNSVAITVNGDSVTAVPFNSTHDDTMDDIVTQIEADIADSSVTLDDIAGDNRTFTIAIEGDDVTTVTCVVTGGASQATATITYSVEDDIKAAAAWAETQKKIYFLTSADSDIITSSTSDLFSDLETLNYDRTAMCYHSALVTSDQYMAEAWLGECLPYNPGSQTWMFKTLTGITAYELTSSERGYVLGKNGNIYTETAGISMTEAGTVASGEYIDIIRGIDWLEAYMSELVFTDLVNTRKIPFTDAGVAIIEGRIKEALDKAVQRGLITDDYEVEVPLVADVSDTDKGNRTLPDITFTATLQGAIHYIEIAGTITL